MKARILIAGSGKMAVNIGLFFLHKGYRLHWLSHSSEQLQNIKKRLSKVQNRIQRIFPEKLETFSAGCSLYDSDIPKPDIFIESSRESLAIKQKIFHSLSHLFDEHTLLFSNSSSIMPHRIHPQCLGAHFFYPVELTHIAELISNSQESGIKYRKSMQFLDENDLDIIEQDERSAFLINRLLLPLQAACFAALQNGFVPAEIEAASKSELISFGQLSLMDSIGLDIVKSAAKNYQSIIPPLLNPDFNILLSSLNQLLDMGKVGSKNKNGLLTGQPLPWSQLKKDTNKLLSLHSQFKQLFEDGCREALRQKMISREHLCMSFDRIFHATTLPHDLCQE